MVGLDKLKWCLAYLSKRGFSIQLFSLHFSSGVIFSPSNRILTYLLGWTMDQPDLERTTHPLKTVRFKHFSTRNWKIGTFHLGQSGFEYWCHCWRTVFRICLPEEAHYTILKRKVLILILTVGWNFDSKLFSFQIISPRLCITYFISLKSKPLSNHSSLLFYCKSSILIQILSFYFYSNSLISVRAAQK